METLVIHPQDAEQLQTIKAVLKALKVKVQVLSDVSVLKEEIPHYVTELMNRSLREADEGKVTSHKDFMNEIKSKLKE